MIEPINKYDANKIADEFIKTCIDEKIISSIIDPEIDDKKDDITYNVGFEFIEKPDVKYRWEDNGELTVTALIGNEEVERVVDPATEDITMLQNHITDSLPEPPFSIDCGGIKTKQIEAKAFYVLCILNKFRSNTFEKEIKDILEKYNFEDMRSEKGDMVFKKLLDDKMLENTKVMDLVVAACYLKLTAAEVKKDSALRDVLRQDDVNALDNLKALIKTDAEVVSLNKRIEERGIKKWKRNQLIESRKDRIKNIVEEKSSILQLIYEVFEQSTDKVPQPDKDRILLRSKQRIAKLKEEYTNMDSYEADRMLSKIKRRAMREQLRQMKARQLQRINEGDWDNLIPKT